MLEQIKESFKKAICTCTFITFLVLGSHLSHAQPLNDQRNSLKGLSCISVSAEVNDNDELSGKLTDEQLNTDVELKLRLAKIEICDTIYTRLEIFINPLEMTYNSGNSSGNFVANISVQLIELTVNTRGKAVTSVTWQNSGTLIAPSKSFSRAIRDYVEDSVNQFINDYLAANPKE